MLENILSGIILASITGITYVAYKHPKGYRRISSKLTALIFLVFVGGSIWNAAVAKTFHVVYEFIDRAKLSEARLAQTSIEIHYAWFFTSLIGCLLYLLFLGLLPVILDLKEDEEQ